MKLDHEMVINSDSVQWVKFYPYEEPTDDLLMCACEVKFNANDQLLTLFDYSAQRIYNYFEENSSYSIWVKKIAWS